MSSNNFDISADIFRGWKSEVEMVSSSFDDVVGEFEVDVEVLVALNTPCSPWV